MRRLWWLAPWVCAACVAAPSPKPPSAPVAPVDPLAPERAAVARALEDAATARRTARRAADDALWAHWVQGAPLPTQVPDAGAPDKLAALLARAEAVDAGPAPLRRALAEALEDEARARALDDVEAELTSSLAFTFPFAGKEVSLRDVPKLLATEPSALKRRALWSASLPAADHARLVLERRRQLERAATDGGVPWASWLRERGLTPKALADEAQALLDETEALRAPALARLSQAELKLPPDKLGRADLPRLLKPPAAFDDLLPKGEVARRLRALCAALVPCDTPALRVDLHEQPKKHPLPLLLPARAPGEPVRLSLVAHGGVLDLVMTATELGAAWGLTAGPAASSAGAGLFATLAHDPAWLEGPGVAPPLTVELAATQRARRVLELRRAAALVLLELEGAPDDARVSALLERALGLPVPPDEARRARLELERPELSAAQVVAALRGAGAWAAAVEALGPAWWRAEAAGQRVPALLTAPPAAPAGLAQALARLLG